MTRKDALEDAMRIVAGARIGKQRKADILEALDLCRRELPFSHWSREAVFDACDTWVQEHGCLHMRDFASPRMPSHTTIRNRFGMAAKDFRDTYYPLAGGPPGSPYARHDAGEWTRRFQEEFHRLRCTGQADYNRRRSRELPTWNTVAAMNGCGTWRRLLESCGLEAYGKPRPRMEVRILTPEESDLACALGPMGVNYCRERARPRDGEGRENREVPLMKPGAIFDMDGLLLDTERVYQESWLETAAAFGQMPLVEFAAAVTGTNGEVQRRIIHRYYPAVDPRAFQKACISRADGILDRQCAPEKPGARALLEFFRAQGVRTAVASSSSRERIRSNLRQSGMEDLFDAVVSGDEVARGKPEPDIFLQAARKLGLPPEDCYVFEDSVNGVRAGMAAGCVTVMVPDTVRPPEDLAPRAVCGSLAEAKTLIEGGRL